MAPTATRLMTAEELEAMPDDGKRDELIEGILQTMSPASFGPSNVAARLVTRIGTFVEEHDLGELTVADGGYVLERGPDTVVAPDVGFVRSDRVPTGEAGNHFAQLPPDLAIKVISPSDRMGAVNGKVERYLAAGVPLVWVFDPRRRSVTVRRRGRGPMLLRDGDVIDGEEVVPGFRLAVSEVFR